MSSTENTPPSMAAKEEPREPAEIRREIEETRAELGETVAAVADKTDVKKQAQLKKDELVDQASAKADELKEQANAKAEEAKAKAKELGEKAKEAAPDSAGEGVAQAQRLAQENPVPLAIAGAFVVGLLLGRLLSR